MLDIRWIREHPELVQQSTGQKGLDFSVEELLVWDCRRRELLAETEELRKERNRLAKRVAQLAQNNDEVLLHREKEIGRDLGVKLADKESELAEAEQHYRKWMLLVPNIVSPDTPPGLSDADNVEVKRVGELPDFPFQPLDHVALGEKLGLFDIPRGVKAAGTRSYYLKGAGLRLHRAVQQLAVDLLEAKGFTVMDVPLLVREEALVRTGFFPLGEEQTYKMADEDRWLVGTSEVPLVSYYTNEVIDVREPVRLAGVSLCFRREIGAAGRDTRGLYRVHQFAKVEQVVLCANDLEESERMLQELTGNAEELLQLLELPYRVVAVCAGDMSQKNYKQYDIETWMPSRGSYGETHSSSMLLDFQARRSNIRYRDDAGNLRFCHTLNNTMAASPRILIPLLENHQQEDGSIYIPKALRPYMNGAADIRG